MLSSTIFKAYDIRGIVDNTLTEPVCKAIGYAFAMQCKALHIQNCVVGRDGRLSGERLLAAVAQGLMAGGVNVIDIGMCTTPMVYWATYHLGTGTGIMITGSHNPPQYNGLKMMLAGDALYGDGIQALRPIAEQYIAKQNLGNVTTGTQLGTWSHRDIMHEYTQRIVQDTHLACPMKVVMDCGNGVAGAVAPQLLKALGVDVIELYSDVDGTFPNHHPDPAKPENLQDLIRTLQASDADVGIAFDGDGDRLGVVTRSGDIIYPDRQMMLFARDVLSRHPGATVVYDVKCSRLLGNVIEQSGGQGLMWKTGHSLIKVKMKEVGALLGGEMSGHLFFKERWYGFDDGVYAAVRLLEILAQAKQAGQSATQVLEALPNSFATPEINIQCAEGEAHQICAQLQQTGQFLGAQEVHTIDGVRAQWDDGFGLARASNTTPVIVLRFEADNDVALARIQAVFMAEIKKIKPTIELVPSQH